jgi:predicted nucleic acid-binding protein
MRLVVDTNVLVAGILSASGPPGWIVEALVSGEVEQGRDAGIRTRNITTFS